MGKGLEIALPGWGWLAGIAGGAAGWAGEIMLIFGTYSVLGGGGFILAGIGFSLICFGEGISLLRGREIEEEMLLRKNIIKVLAQNMAFPALWLLIFFASGFELLLALAAATGIKAIVRNAGAIASFYTSSSA